MPITLKVRVSDGDQDIEKKVMAAVKKKLGRALKGSALTIKRRIGSVCDLLITRTEEYKSLLTGELLGELGIPDVESRVRSILKTIREGVEVSVQPIVMSGSRISGGMSISILRSDFEDILDLPASTYVSNGKYVIPWLNWLIVQGDRINVVGWDVNFRLDAAGRARSRTGIALMTPKKGGGWRVPPEYSGTVTDNFLTRAFDGANVSVLIGQIMQEEIQRRLDS